MPHDNSRQILGALAIVLLAVPASLFIFQDNASADLLASWLAGHFYQSGALDQIYPHDTVAYTMLPPPDWIPYLRKIGYQGEVYPFIYPPIWAVLFGWLTRITDFIHVARIANIVNPALMGSMVVLAWRICAPQMSAVRYTAIAMLILFGSTIGSIALYQNQPQILVSFLIVLAVERSRADAPFTAGAALALAAAIKLYPAAFALLWLATGNRRALAAFVITGAGLGVLSITLAGWPLHQTFLHQLALINKTVLVTSYSFSLDPSLGQLFFANKMQTIVSPGVSAHIQGISGPATPPIWRVMVKPSLWAALSSGLMIAVLAFVALRMRKAHASQRALLWPLAFGLFALVSPLSWGYHYLPAVAFAPVLLDRFGTGRGSVILGLIFIPLMLPLLPLYQYLGFVRQPYQIIGTVAMGVYCVALALAIRHKTPE